MRSATNIIKPSFFRSYSVKTGLLSKRISELIPIKGHEIQAIKKEHGDKIIGTCTVTQAYGGMRGVKSMVTETSLLDSEEGIRFRGLSIPECQELLPKWENSDQPLPESLIWLLLTGEVPTQEEALSVSKELADRSDVPDHVFDVIERLSKSNVHPMSQLVSAVSAAQSESEFAKAYRDGSVKKKDFWIPTLEDSLRIMAQLPAIAASIYQNLYRSNNNKPVYNKDLDWSANYAQMLGFEDEGFSELMRCYMVIHSDHEGGNVSAHATHLVGSALSDPYLSFAAGMSGLAGPLHGLANQEVLRWLLSVQEKIESKGKKELTDGEMEDLVWETLNNGQVVPGYGHAVLRKTDPRFTAQAEFASKTMPDDPLVKLVGQMHRVVPGVLLEHGKTANPYPNVDAHSGPLLRYYGLTEFDYYTVLFGVSRATGVLSSLVWDRALGFPLERPKSVTSDWIKAQMEKESN